MEEVAPVATSDANLLAPEELQARSKRPEVGTTEKTTTDRKRERRLKKMRKRLQVAEKKQRDKIVAKLRPRLGNKYSKKTLEKKMKLREEGEEMDKSLRNSSRFFARLQEEVREQVKSVKAGGKSGTDRKRTAQQYKLWWGMFFSVFLEDFDYLCLPTLICICNISVVNWEEYSNQMGDPGN